MTWQPCPTGSCRRGSTGGRREPVVRRYVNGRLLLAGEIVGPSSLAQLQRTVPVVSQEGRTIDYGLGLHPREGPGRSTYWGHGGTVWGGGALAMTRADGARQMAVAVNLQRWNRLDSSGTPQPHPIDDALATLYRLAMDD